MNYPCPTFRSLDRLLDTEWTRLVCSTAAARALSRWSCLEPVVDGFADLDQLCESAQDRGDPERSDRILAALMRLAAVSGHDDRLAAAAVLRVLTPRAVDLARELASVLGGPFTSDALVFGELAILIREAHPLREPARPVAATLLMDCRDRLIRDHRKRPVIEYAAGLDLQGVSFDVVPGADDGGWFALRDLLEWARRRRILSDLEIRLLVGSRVFDLPLHRLIIGGMPHSTMLAIRAWAEARLRRALVAAGYPGSRP